MHMKPYHQEITSSFSGWQELTRPFVAFLLFLMGKVLSLISFILSLEIWQPGLTETKPYTVFAIIGVFLLAPLGLQFFISFQEFVFYSFSSYHSAFVNHLLGVSKRSDGISVKRNTVSCIISPKGLNFHEALLDLRDMMASMTQIFGPFLLQNLTLMLLYWLLHLYNLCLSGYYIFANFSSLSHTPLLLQCLGLAGSALIVRWNRITQKAFATSNTNSMIILTNSTQILKTCTSAEFWRVVTLSSACSCFTERVEEVFLMDFLIALNMIIWSWYQNIYSEVKNICWIWSFDLDIRIFAFQVVAMIEEKKVQTKDDNEVKVSEEKEPSQRVREGIFSFQTLSLFPQMCDFFIACLRRYSVITASGYFTVSWTLFKVVFLVNNWRWWCSKDLRTLRKLNYVLLQVNWPPLWQPSKWFHREFHQLRLAASYFPFSVLK